MNPSQVLLDPTKRYYISVLPGDAANPFNTGNAQKGHGMGGAPMRRSLQTGARRAPPRSRQSRVLTQPTPLPPAKLSVFVFEDDFPLNGEQDAGGGRRHVAPTSRVSAASTSPCSTMPAAPAMPPAR